jgi:hypothetical protein
LAPENRWNYPAWNPSNSGIAGNPIIFKAFPGEIPILDHGPYGPAIGSNGRSYIIWDGFQSSRPVSPNNKYFGAFWSNNHCTLQNCIIYGTDAGTAAGNNPNV